MLAERADVSATLLAADPAAMAAAAEQLLRLRGSALGHWLRPVPAAAPGAGAAAALTGPG